MCIELENLVVGKEIMQMCDIYGVDKVIKQLKVSLNIVQEQSGEVEQQQVVYLQGASQHQP